jgi:hypothetical protein
MVFRPGFAVLLSFSLLLCCAQPQKPRAKAPPPDPIAATEKLAFEAEREINLAENALREEQPDRATEHLDVADRSLSTSQIDTYPDASRLRERYLELLKRVPEVRENVRKKELAAQVEKSKTKIEAAKGNLKEALVAIKKKNPEEADLKRASESVDAVRTALEEGTELESKDAEYSKWALSVRKDLGDKKKTVEQRQLEVEIERAKSNISRSLADLGASMKKLQTKDVADADFQVARTAWDDAQKALSEGEALVSKDVKFAKYFGEVRSRMETQKNSIGERLHDVEVRRQKVTLEEKRKALAQSLNRLGTPGPGVVEEATAAMGEVQKGIDEGAALAAKDIDYAKYLADVKKSLGAAKERIEMREEAIAVEAQKAKVEVELANLKNAAAGLQGFSVTEEQFKATADAIAAANKALSEGTELEHKVGKYNEWAMQKKKIVRAYEEKTGKRKTDVSLREHRLLVEQTFDAAKTAVAAVKTAEANGETMKDAETAIKTCRDEIQKSLELERADKSFAAYTAKVRTELDKLNETVRETKSTVAFRDGAIAPLDEGKKIVGEVDAQSPADQQKALGSALESFRACKKNGAQVLGDHPRLAVAQFVVSGKKTKAAAVLTECGEHAKNTEARLTAIEPTVGFYEGPAKAYLRGKELLDAGAQAKTPEEKKKANSEALTEMESCIEKGKILQHKHPQLERTKFDVDGQVTTLPLVVSACQTEAKTLRAAAGGDKT